MMGFFFAEIELWDFGEMGHFQLLLFWMSWRAKVLVYRMFFPVEESCHDGRKTEHWMSLPSLYIGEHRLRNCVGKCGVQIVQKIQISFLFVEQKFQNDKKTRKIGQQKFPRQHQTSSFKVSIARLSSFRSHQASIWWS